MVQAVDAGGVINRCGEGPADEELVIAFNVNLPSWDATTGLSSVNPTIQAIYQSVFDMYIHQDPDLSFAPGLITDRGWNDGKTQIHMQVRDCVTWHDGNPIQFIWSKIGNFVIDGNRITADVLEFEPTIFQ